MLPAANINMSLWAVKTCNIFISFRKFPEQVIPKVYAISKNAVIIESLPKIFKHMGMNRNVLIRFSQYTLEEFIPVSFDCNFEAVDLSTYRKEVTQDIEAEVDQGKGPVIILK